MKTAEPKTASSPHLHQAGQPFFQWNGESAFFSGSQTDLQTTPFFSKQTAQPFIQTKLNIGQPGDKYEQEADAMADMVVQRLSNSETIQTKPAISLANTVTRLVQPKCAACEEEEQIQKKEEDEDRLKNRIHLKPVFESDEPPPEEEIQRKCAECEAEEKLQKKGQESTASPSLESSLASSKGTGNPLPESIRQQMESSFDADFSSVRIHIGSSAEQMNQELQAQAFTHGSDIYFGKGRYNSESTEGKQLLAHELTHVLQQGASTIHRQIFNQPETFRCKENIIQTYPQAGEQLPSTKKQKRYYSHRNDVVDIMGKGTFAPGSGLGNYIASLWENGQQAPVNIKFGSLASGYIWINQSGSYYSKRCAYIPASLFWGIKVCKDSPPETSNYNAPPQVIPVDHNAFTTKGEGSLVLLMGINNGLIYGKLGWIAGKKSDVIEPLMDASLAVTNEDVFMPLIYGTDYDGTNYSSDHYNNQILSGDLYFSTLGELHLPIQQKIQGIFIINNNVHQWNANLVGKPKGLEEYKVPVKRSADAVLTGEAVGLNLDTSWTGGNTDSEDGKFAATGQLRLSYQQGVIDIFGKATYSSARINGEVNIALTQESKAMDLFTQHAPGTKTKAAQATPAPLPPAPEENLQEPLALTGWGNLSFKLIDTSKSKSSSNGNTHTPTSPLADLEGEGAFAVSPDGFIILAGKLKFPAKWLLTGELNYRSDDAKDEDKHLFRYDKTLARAPVPFGSVNLEMGITVDADAHLDPLELYEITVSGVYSNHPSYRSELDFTPRFYISGNAGARLNVKGNAAYRLIGIFKVGEVSGELNGDVRAQAYIDAAPTIKKIWEDRDMPATYAIEGTIYTAGKITFTLTGGISVNVLKADILKTADYQIGSWTLGEFGAILKMNEYIIGSADKPAFDYSKMGFGTRQRRSLASAIARGKESTPEAGDKRIGGFKQLENGEEKEKGTFSETQPSRPDLDASPIINKLKEDFLMIDELHQLILTFSGTRKSPAALIEMASDLKEPLSNKLEKEKLIVATEEIFSTKEESVQHKTRMRDIEAIKTEVADVTKNAIGAAQKVEENEEPHVAGFDRLDDRLTAYGKKYNTSNIGTGTVGPSTIPSETTTRPVPPRVVGADSRLEQLLTEKRTEVGYNSFDDFRSSNVAVFRYYVLKPGARQIDDNADGPFFESAVNVAKELHSEQIIAGRLQEIQQSAAFRKKYGPSYIITVNQVLSERSPCSMCRDFLVNNPSTLVVTSNYNTYYMVHYSGSWIARNRSLMLKYGLKPPPLADLQKQYGGRNQDPH